MIKVNENFTEILIHIYLAHEENWPIRVRNYNYLLWPRDVKWYNYIGKAAWQFLRIWTIWSSHSTCMYLPRRTDTRICTQMLRSVLFVTTSNLKSHSNSPHYVSRKTKYGISLSQKEWTIDTCNNMAFTWDHMFRATVCLWGILSKREKKREERSGLNLIIWRLSPPQNIFLRQLP